MNKFALDLVQPGSKYVIYGKDEKYNYQTTETKRKLQINNDYFFKGYNAAMRKGYMDLQESRNGAWSSLVFDIDIHKKSKVLIPCYTEEKLTQIFEYLLLNLLPSSFKNLKNEHKTITLSEKKPYFKEKGLVSHGVHFQCLNIFVSEIAASLIHKELKKYVDLYFQEGYIKFEVDDVSKKPWYVYGSCAKDKKPYISSGKTWVVKDGKVIKIDTDRYIRKYVSVDGIDWKKVDNISYYYPMVFSIYRIWRINHLGEDIAYDYDMTAIIIADTIKESKRAIINKDKEYPDMDSKETLKTTLKLMNNISPNRANGYDDWIQMGILLYNIGDGDTKYLDIWIEFSKKTTSGNFDEAVCLSNWDKFEKRNMTIATLFSYAKSDYPDRYITKEDDVDEKERTVETVFFERRKKKKAVVVKKKKKNTQSFQWED